MKEVNLCIGLRSFVLEIVCHKSRGPRALFLGDHGGLTEMDRRKRHSMIDTFVFTAITQPDSWEYREYCDMNHCLFPVTRVEFVQGLHHDGHHQRPFEFSSGLHTLATRVAPTTVALAQATQRNTARVQRDALGAKVRTTGVSPGNRIVPRASCPPGVDPWTP